MRNVEKKGVHVRVCGWVCACGCAQGVCVSVDVSVCVCVCKKLINISDQYGSMVSVCVCMRVCESARVYERERGNILE